MGMTEEVRSESMPTPRESAAGTIRVTLDFPAAVLEEFQAASRARLAAHQGWQSLEDYLCNHALTSLLAEHQRRIIAEARRTACLPLSFPQEPEMNARRAWLHRIAPDEEGVRRTSEKEERGRNMNDLIFLGGTVGCNRWREERVIPGLLARGVDRACLFNPVGDRWDSPARAREDRVKAQARYQLYVLASPSPASPTPTDCLPAYSLVEATMALYEGRGVVVVDDTHLSPDARTVLQKCFSDWRARFPDAPLFTDYEEMMDWLAARLCAEHPPQRQTTEPMPAVTPVRQCGVQGCANAARPWVFCHVCGLALCENHLTLVHPPEPGREPYRACPNHVRHIHG